MTREEKLFSMTMKVLAEEAEKLGVKINKKGKKEDAVNKILAYERMLKEVNEINLDDYEEVTEETTAPETEEVTEDPTAEHIVEVEVTEVTTEPAEEVTEVPTPTKRESKCKKYAEDFLADIPADAYTVDKKGRYNFKKQFHLIFKKDAITLAPSKKFRETHAINWEYHEGWANPYRTVVTPEFAMSAIIETLA